MDEQNAMPMRKAMLNLYVMNTISRYNILLGRTAVCKLGIVSSNIHGMVKFATSKGIATVTSAVPEPLCASIMVGDNIGTEGKRNLLNKSCKISKMMKQQKLLATKNVVNVANVNLKDMSDKPLVISCKVANTGITIIKIHVDTGSSIHLIYEQCFLQLLECIKADLKATAISLSGFAGESAWPMGKLSLKIELRDEIDVKLTRQAQSICAAISTQDAVVAHKIVEDHMVVVNCRNPDQKIKIGTELDQKIRKKIVQLLVAYMDVFAWSEQDMTGVLRDIAEHRLNANPALKPIVQKRRGMAPDRMKWLCAEVTKLVNAGILREVKYQTWVANPVLVKKPDCRNLEAYVDDLGIKSKTQEKILFDMEETFESLRKIKMKLNPSKCSLGEREGKFLGYYVTEQGIQANPKKITAIENMIAPKTVKKVQSLTGKISALTRFLSKAADRQFPFFRTLKGCLKQKNFVWTEEAYKAFQEMKQLLATLPTLIAPVDGEILYLYISIANESFGSVLVSELNKVQKLVYFVSKALARSEITYAPIEKFIYALVFTSRRLCRYFQGHPIHVLTDLPVKQVLSTTAVSGRLAKWAIDLGAFEIAYLPRTSVKGYVLADYLAEMTGELEVIHERTQLKPLQHEIWDLYTDGSSCIEGAGAGLVLTIPSGEEHTYALRFNFDVTNNEAEYEALLAGLNVALSRSQNKKADALSKLDALTFSHFQKQVWVEELPHKSIDGSLIVAAIEEVQPNWMDPIMHYLRNNTLPEDKKEARLVRERSPMYVIENDMLYRKSYLGPLMRCVGPAEAVIIIEEVHSGYCALHSGYKTIAAKIMPMGNFWPTLYRDVAQIVKRCKSCQRLMAAIRETNNKQQIAKYYNKKVRALAFDIGKWVLQNNEASRAEKLRKLGPNWEGPYQIMGINAAGSYKLQDIEGRHLSNAWHATLLKRYYM
ncbi:uncharacterized protein [Rutidosis leptorrhynchoides]|uniref:uncharacterized protein n=1 Tax=Rutidosis leptorrhynchoides TaxID=125765 RepID=UPI003A99AD6F